MSLMIALWCCNGDVINDVIKHSNVVIQIDVILEGGSLLWRSNPNARLQMGVRMEAAPLPPNHGGDGFLT
jgi:hypothetical protein